MKKDYTCIDFKQTENEWFQWSPNLKIWIEQEGDYLCDICRKISMYPFYIKYEALYHKNQSFHNCVLFYWKYDLIGYINDCIWTDFKNPAHVHHIYFGIVHIQLAYIVSDSLHISNITFLAYSGQNITRRCIHRMNAKHMYNDMLSRWQ